MEDVLLLHRRAARRGRAGRRPGPPAVQVVRRRRVPGRLARSSRRCSTCGSAAATSCAWSATRRRRSTPSPAPTPTTCATSRPSSPAPPRSSWSATTARPRRSSRPPTRLLAGTAEPGRRAARPAARPGPAVDVRTTHADEVAEAEAGRRPDRRAASHGGAAPAEIAVLFRINAQSEAFEEALAGRGIPYVVRGAARFFDRPEVRAGGHPAARRAPAAGEGDAGGCVGRPCAAIARRRWAGPPRRRRRAARPATAGSRWQALVDQADEFAPAGRRRPRRLRRRPRPARRRAARPRRRRRHARDLPRRQGPRVGRGLPLRAPGRHAADHLRRDAGRGRGGAPAALRRHDPRPARPARSPGRWPAARRPRLPQAVAVPRPAAARRTPAARRREPRSRKAGADAAASAASRCSTGAEKKRRPLRRLPGVLRRGSCSSGCASGARARADEEEVPAFVVFTDATLQPIAEIKPAARRGAAADQRASARQKLDKYGEEILRSSATNSRREARDGKLFEIPVNRLPIDPRRQPVPCSRTPNNPRTSDPDKLRRPMHRRRWHSMNNIINPQTAADRRMIPSRLRHARVRSRVHRRHRRVIGRRAR